MIKNKRILCIGGAGSIGSELVKQLAPFNKIFILDINETGAFGLREELKQKGHWVHSRTGDIRDKNTISDVFEDFKPQIVFHAAALKHVTPNEEYPREAIDTNILGTDNLISEAKRWECLEKFVFISTDKVVNASCIMGITKLCAEGLIRRAGSKFVAVRFGNVLGSRGSVLEIWERQYSVGEPLTITVPSMTRYTMAISQACELVIEAAENGKNGEVYIMNMGEPINIMDLYQDFIEKKRNLAFYGTEHGQGIGEDDLNPPKEYPVKFIGIRLGETLKEELMTIEEKKRAIKKGNFWIIC